MTRYRESELVDIIEGMLYESANSWTYYPPNAKVSANRLQTAELRRNQAFFVASAVDDMYPS